MPTTLWDRYSGAMLLVLSTMLLFTSWHVSTLRKQLADAVNLAQQCQATFDDARRSWLNADQRRFEELQQVTKEVHEFEIRHNHPCPEVCAK